VAVVEGVEERDQLAVQAVQAAPVS